MGRNIVTFMYGNKHLHLITCEDVRRIDSLGGIFHSVGNRFVIDDNEYIIYLFVREKNTERNRLLIFN